MRKIVPSILLPLLLSLGCGYKVHVYGEPEVGKSRTDMPPGASVHVELHPSAIPFADHERAAQRIEASLESRGFKLTSEKRADFVLLFDCVSKQGSAGGDLWPVVSLATEATRLSIDGSGNPRLNERDDVMRDAAGGRDPNPPPRASDPSISDRIWVHYVTLQLVDSSTSGRSPVWTGWAQWDKTLVQDVPDEVIDALVDGAFRRFPVRTNGIEKVMVKPTAAGP